jgi:integrase
MYPLLFWLNFPRRGQPYYAASARGENREDAENVANHEGTTLEVGIIRDAALWRLCRYRHKRHTFAVHRLLRWYRQGADVQSRLSALATFMGHVDLKHTQVYLTATEELLQQANERFYRQFGSLLNDEEVKS